MSDDEEVVQEQQVDEVLLVKILGTVYGIDIMCIQEIRECCPPTPVSNMPPFMRGVINLRGVIVPVIDLRLQMGCETPSFESPAAMVMLRLQSRTVGVVVDATSGILELKKDRVKFPPDDDSNAKHVIGSAETEEGEPFFILSPEVLLEDLLALPRWQCTGFTF